MTEKTPWTPGPWSIPVPSMGFSEIRGGSGELIFGIAAGGPSEKQSDEICTANARLIAAAPKMAEALERLLLGAYATWMAARAEVEGAKTSHDLFEKEPEVIAARAVLAEARGEP